MTTLLLFLLGIRKPGKQSSSSQKKPLVHKRGSYSKDSGKQSSDVSVLNNEPLNCSSDQTVQQKKKPPRSIDSTHFFTRSSIRDYQLQSTRRTRIGSFRMLVSSLPFPKPSIFPPQHLFPSPDSFVIKDIPGFFERSTIPKPGREKTLVVFSIHVLISLSNCLFYHITHFKKQNFERIPGRDIFFFHSVSTLQLAYE